MNNIWIKASTVESTPSPTWQSWAPGNANIYKLHGNCLTLPRGCDLIMETFHPWIEILKEVDLYSNKRVCECTGKWARMGVV